MFRGIHMINIDAKGRCAIPTCYRENLSEHAERQLVVTIDTESPCLLLYPLPEWEVIERKLEALPSFNAQARRIQRLLIGHAQEVELDSSGRILLPPPLREFASLDKKVALVGQGKKFEIWSETCWYESRREWLENQPLSESILPDDVKTLSL